MSAPRCHGDNCTATATHGPDGVPVACWSHAGDFPEVARVEPPTGKRVFCEHCGWRGRDTDCVGEARGCPQCKKLFGITEEPAL